MTTERSRETRQRERQQATASHSTVDPSTSAFDEDVFADGVSDIDASHPPDDNAAMPTLPVSGTSLAKVVGVAVLAVVGFLALFNSPEPAASETLHPNWSQHVAVLNSMNQQQAQQGKQLVIKRVTQGGVVSFDATLPLTDADKDANTTKEVKDALQSGDASKAEQILQAAQAFPVPKHQPQQKVPVRKPTLTKGLSDAILSGDSEFFHIYLYDACAEDGDVVEVLINGESFAVVPITHRGATLSVPIGISTSTSVAIHGVRDGGGGITVACRTSQGDSFTRAMLEGEVQPLSVVH